MQTDLEIGNAKYVQESKANVQAVSDCGFVSESTRPKPSEYDIQEKPWKFVGYRGYAEFLASDDELLIFRRFSALNARVMLAMQDQITLLEEQLLAVDEEFSSIYARDINNGTLRDDEMGRDRMLSQLGDALLKYSTLFALTFHALRADRDARDLITSIRTDTTADELLLQQTKLKGYAKAPKRNFKNIHNWHQNHEFKAIDLEEHNYLHHEEDLICLVQKEKTPLRKAIDSSLRLRTSSLWRDDSKKVADHDADTISYYSDARLDRFVSGVIVFVGITMLITPIWILRSVTNFDMMLIVITVFVFVFLLVLSLFMAAKPFEALGATAAYVISSGGVSGVSKT